MYFQPIKNNDHKIDFYTMYRRETMDYDSESMQKYNEDLNTTLIFVRVRAPFQTKILTSSPGWSILCGQFRLCPQYPDGAPARPR